ncbi:beta-glucosidase family protein [Paenibacillus sp. MMO-177]|uniref:beta-glucosidase family protein n=1 Tax=Paenibacillus sp. MMO-177 TaxID=3081289 RepID=UPI003018511F
MKTSAELLSLLTLEEKASLVAGSNMWMTKGIERLGIPAIHMYDGTNGIRKTNSDEEMGVTGQNIPATCYPTGSAIGSSWSTELLHEVGVALGKEGRSMGVELLLGPGINMKRTPLGGRNFEYYSEDPCLSGELGASFINGLQSEGVGASVKHFACNNQEFEKMVTSSEVDERTLREIYLSAFERIVKKAKPWTLMCSYNLLNGSYASENEHLLHDILRREWGYDGVVISDWTAVNDRLRGLKAGLDLEMPGPADYNAKAIVEAVKKGTLDEAVLDSSVRRILDLVAKTTAGSEQAAEAADYHELARKAAAESIVLLKNDNGILPLDRETLGSVAVIGRFAKQPRIQGAGSANVTPTRVDIPFDELESLAGSSVKLSYAEGYPQEDIVDDRLIAESVAIAAASEAAILFVGQPEFAESEMHDLKGIELPAHQVKLIQAVAAVQPRCIVVTSSGSALAMRAWVQQVPGVIHSWLGGQGSGKAIADILLGAANPSGKLSETFPVKLSDNPSHMRIRGENGKLHYREGLFIGYRYYDKKELAPEFPFGHGLSYTSFAYSGLKTVQQPDGQVEVTFKVANTGSVSGKEVVQLYVHDEECKWTRPEKELKAFAKIELAPGEAKEVSFVLEERDFAYYNTKFGKWVAETGYFLISVGSSSRDIRLRGRLHCDFGEEKATFHQFSLFIDWLNDPVAKKVLERFLDEMNAHIVDKIQLNDEFVGFWDDFPVVKLIQMFGQSWLGERSPNEVIEELIGQIEEERMALGSK